MLKHIVKFLSIIMVAITFAGGAFATEGDIYSTGDIGEYGAWTTPRNHELITGAIQADINGFAPNAQMTDDYVPIEAKVGLAFINAMSRVATIIDNSLANFATIFILLMYVFWIMGEAYNNIQTGWDIKKLGQEITIKTIKVVIWTAVLLAGPAQIFTMLITPIVMAGAYVADAILNAVSGTIGVSLPDTCSAIRDHVSTNLAQHAILSQDATTAIMCLPTRMSGFFASGIAVGWEYIKQSLLNSFFLFLAGIALVWLFIVNMWKFAFMAFGVIADLVLAIIMLPFTAIAETVTKTSYKGIAGNVYNTFTGLFKTESLKVQIGRVISATIYFIVLSVVIAICTSLLAGVIDINNSSLTIKTGTQDIIPLLLTGLIIRYLITNADKIAKDWGGSVTDEFGNKLRNYVEGVAKDTHQKYKDIRKKLKSD